MALPRFCPDCGARLQAMDASSTRCPSCDKVHFASSRPAAGVFIERGGRLLLVRRGVEPGKGSWDVPGGFLDEGEVPEGGARREIREELGLELGELSLLAVDVNPLADAAVLDVLFQTGDARGEPRPGSDVSEVSWFDPEALPLDDLAFASTRRILDRWREPRRVRERRLLDGELPRPVAVDRLALFEAPWSAPPAGSRVEAGDWRVHDGVLCGSIDGERPAVLWLEPEIEGDHMLVFTAWTVPPHDQDINCYWEGSGRILGEGADVACTIGGLAGWRSGVSGIERYPEGSLRATARVAHIEPGRSYEVCAGRRGTGDFLFVDGALAMEIDEPGRTRRARSRVALSTWNSHVHFARVAVYRLPTRR